MSKNELKIEAGEDALAGVPMTHNVETSAKLETDAMTNAFEKAEEKAHEKAGYFKGKEKKENERRADVMDSEFWCSFVFKTRGQKETFLKGLGLDLDDFGDKFLDGEKVAAKLEIKLPKVSLRQTGQKEDRRMTLGADPIEQPETLKPEGGD